MQEKNPEFHKEIPHSPEQAEQDFYDAAENRNFATQAERERLKDGVTELAQPKKSPEVTGAEVHHEAGIPLKAKYASEAEATEAMTKLIEGGKDIHPNDLHNKMSAAWDEWHDKAA